MHCLLGVLNDFKSTPTNNGNNINNCGMADFQPQSMTAPPASSAHNNSQQLQQPNGDLRLVVAGFEECAAEAVRYLLEEEGLQCDDPVITGLREHLEAQRRILNYERVVGSYLETQLRRAAEDIMVEEETDEEDEEGPGSEDEGSEDQVMDEDDEYVANLENNIISLSDDCEFLDKLLVHHAGLSETQRHLTWISRMNESGSVGGIGHGGHESGNTSAAVFDRGPPSSPSPSI